MLSLSLSPIQSERSELIEQIKALRSDNHQIRKIADEKFKEIEPLQKDLKKLRNADYASRNGGLSSSEEELDARVFFLSKLCVSPNSSIYLCP
jgi:uncharacterized coiled-coil DUF342 family protein